MSYFMASAIQPSVYQCTSREEIFDKNLTRQLAMLDLTMVRSSRLVVFPEFALHGIPQNADGTWNGVSIDIPGEETDALGRKARKRGMYLVSHAWVEYDDLPGRPMSVGFVISPDGEVILRHHKTVPSRVVEAADAGPGDVLEWFTDKFGGGLDAFFPVVETEIGRIGIQICGEGTYGETSRGLAMNGAELIARPNAWVEPGLAEPADVMSLCTRFAAFSNMAYVVESNYSDYHDPNHFRSPGSGGSQIVDYLGRVMARAHTTGETVVGSEINMDSLRRHREEAAFGGRTSFLPTEIFRTIYEKELWPHNLLMDKTSSLGIREWNDKRREMIQRRADIFASSSRTTA